MSKAEKGKVSQDVLLTLFCTAVDRAGAAPVTPKVAVFAGRRMYGKRLYETEKAARQAVTKLAPKFCKALEDQILQRGARQLKRALSNKKFRKQAVDEAFRREVLYIQPVVRNTPSVVTQPSPSSNLSP